MKPYSALIRYLVAYLYQRLAEHIFGKKPSEFVTRPASWLDCIHPEDRGRVQEGFQLLINYGALDAEYRLLRQDGNDRWIQMRAKSIWSEHRDTVRAEGIITDITDRMQRDNHLAHLNGQLTKRNERLQALHQIDAAIATSQDLSVTLGMCLDQLTKHLEVDAARILIFDAFSQRLNMRLVQGFITAEVAIFRE